VSAGEDFQFHFVVGPSFFLRHAFEHQHLRN
jgi:hypothetical protein